MQGLMEEKDQAARTAHKLVEAEGLGAYCDRALGGRKISPATLSEGTRLRMSGAHVEQALTSYSPNNSGFQ
jgi:hypothetical protein